MSELERYTEWVQSAGRQYPKLVGRIKRGDLIALNQYTRHLSETSVALIDRYLNSNEFISLSAEDKASAVRKIIGGGTGVLHELTATATFEGMTATLKKQGYVTTAAPADNPDELLKGIIGVSLLEMLDKDNHLFGAQQLTGGTQKVISSGMRSSMVNTSEKIADLFGGPLIFVRVAVHTPCNYCEALAGVEFPLKHTVDGAHFHDFCQCELVPVEK